MQPIVQGGAHVCPPVRPSLLGATHACPCGQSYDDHLPGVRPRYYGGGCGVLLSVWPYRGVCVRCHVVLSLCCADVFDGGLSF